MEHIRRNQAQRFNVTNHSRRVTISPVAVTERRLTVSSGSRASRERRSGCYRCPAGIRRRRRRAEGGGASASAVLFVEHVGADPDRMREPGREGKAVVGECDSGRARNRVSQRARDRLADCHNGVHDSRGAGAPGCRCTGNQGLAEQREGRCMRPDRAVQVNPGRLLSGGLLPGAQAPRFGIAERAGARRRSGSAARIVSR